LPTFARFGGVQIGMFYNEEHRVPHFHATHGEFEATFRLDTLEVIAGGLPRRIENLVRGWASVHREEIAENWRRARAADSMFMIEGPE
jgi:hypothetical protein